MEQRSKVNTNLVWFDCFYKYDTLCLLDSNLIQVVLDWPAENYIQTAYRQWRILITEGEVNIGEYLPRLDF